MNFIFKMILSAFWLLAVPAGSGALFLVKKERITWGESFLAGYLFLFSAAEILTLVLMMLNQPLHLLVICYGTLSTLTALAGFLLIRKRGLFSVRQTFGSVRRTSLYFWAAVILILLQVAILVICAHLDADDALYVGTATTAVETDQIFRVNAYTGIPYVRLPRRYILSPFPIFLAVVSQLSGGLHPAIMAHTVFPAVFVPACYLVLYQLAKKWFPEDKNARGIFLFLTVVLCWFSAYSVYNSGNFQMVRIWQGKALLAAFLLPLVFYLSLSIVMEEKPAYSWWLYAMANISGCLLSSMGIILTPVMMAVFLVLGLFRFKSLKRTLQGAACCLPSVILGAAYILILLLRGRGLL